MFIALILRAMKNDVNITRVAAFAKRLLQVCIVSILGIRFVVIVIFGWFDDWKTTIMSIYCLHT